MTDAPTVLFVDDQAAIADGHAARLPNDHETRTAYDGETALETLDDDVDVACLDRRMPGMSGKELLDAIRERGYDCRVVMLTGVEPDRDAVEMGFDEYIVKPVDGDELRDTIDRLATEPATDVDDDVLDALGDPKTRRCCYALAETPKSARELADETGYSLPTVYRRLNALQQAGIIESRTRLDPDGDHHDTFIAVTTRIQIDLEDGVRVDIDRTDEPAI
ncbi:MAG: two-component system response regulator AdeR [Natronomonas sp.]|jgi:two-component system response regulator AdeR|uniref:response regulator n=1 Tax=Natronomonas sp. TaxID=2184060 RepID=UPI00398927FD